MGGRKGGEGFTSHEKLLKGFQVPLPSSQVGGRQTPQVHALHVGPRYYELAHNIGEAPLRSMVQCCTDVGQVRG